MPIHPFQTLSPQQNMDLDLQLLEQVEAGAEPMHCRFYAWDRPAISLGIRQRAVDWIDRTAAAAAGGAVVVRPTGGAAAFHGHDLSFALVLGDTHPWFPRRPLDLVLRLQGLWQQALRTAEVAAPPQAGCDLQDLCLLSRSKTDLLAQGHKVGGMALRHRRKGILIQGFVVLSSAAPQLDWIRPSHRPEFGQLAYVANLNSAQLQELFLNAAEGLLG